MRAGIHPRSFSASVPGAYWVLLCAAAPWLAFGIAMKSVGLL